MGDKLVKAMEAKEKFDNRIEKPKEDTYVNKVNLLKKTLTEEYKFCTQNKEHHKQYALKLVTINKHIDYIKKIQSQKTFNKMDQELIDKLIQKYGINNQ
jgi:hypothetical protein